MPAEVAAPALASWMKQTDDFPGFRIDTGQIWTFVFVVVVASQRQITRMVFAAVLPGDDVFRVHSVERLIVLVNTAVFTAITRTLPDKLARGGVDHERSWTFSSWRALAWRMAR